MSRQHRSCALACLLLATAWLISGPGRSSPFQGRATAQEPPDVADLGQAPAEMEGEGMEMEEGAAPTPGRRQRTRKARAAASRSSRPSRKTAAPAATGGPAPPNQAEKPAGASSGVAFSRDVAPILVANCVGCHTQGRPGLERGKLDLTTFEKLMKGTTGGEKVVVAGDPAESHLILRIKGEEEPRMPQGGNNDGLAEPVIARFVDWVKAGATLDAGLDPKAPIASYAASLADVERANLAKQSPADRLARITSVGLERWKKANPNAKPEVTPGEHFVVFTDAPKDRAAAALKAMESQYANLQRLLGAGAVPWVEKASLYVFSDRKDYVEFVRTVEQREVDSDESAHGDFQKPEPYVAAADPHDAAVKSEPTARRKTGRRRRGDHDESDAGGGSRTLVGLLTENMAESAVHASGKSPRWLAAGVGTFLASRTEPRADYYRGLRRTATEKCQQDWEGAASQTLGDGDGVSPHEFRAVGFALVECLNSARFRPLFPALAKDMAAQGGTKLDDVLKEVYNADRKVFLDVTGQWVMQTYGGG